MNATFELLSAAVHMQNTVWSDLQDRHVRKVAARICDHHICCVVLVSLYIIELSRIWYKHRYNIDTNIIYNFFPSIIWIDTTMAHSTCSTLSIKYVVQKTLLLFRKNTLGNLWTLCMRQIMSILWRTSHSLILLWGLRRRWRLLCEYGCWMQESAGGTDWRHV